VADPAERLPHGRSSTVVVVATVVAAAFALAIADDFGTELVLAGVMLVAMCWIVSSGVRRTTTEQIANGTGRAGDLEKAEQVVRGVRVAGVAALVAFIVAAIARALVGQ
jgi:hypothetical protein